MKSHHVDHIGINVNDLDNAKAFFIDLGFKVLGKATMQGKLVGRVTGLKDVHDDLVMLQAPDRQVNLELVKFHHPIDQGGVQPAPANKLGLRHLAFQVDDVEEIVAVLKQKGHELVDEIQTYQNIWKLCYIRGPEGIILELAEKLK